MLGPGRGRTKTGRLWCYAVDDRPWDGPAHPAAAYVHSKDRRGERPAGHLAGFRGCRRLLAHMRRPFYEFHAATQSPLAAEVLARIRELYAIEAEIRGHPAEHRAQVRHDRSRPIVEALHAWLQNHAGRVSAASDLPKAIRCAFRHWDGLVVFLDDGRVEMDTNVVERAISPKRAAFATGPSVLTRRNALFAGSDGGARHWAVAMTLIQTAKLNGVEPTAWLTNVLECVASGRTKAHELHALLPWNWRANSDADCPAPTTA